MGLPGALMENSSRQHIGAPSKISPIRKPARIFLSTTSRSQSKYGMHHQEPNSSHSKDTLILSMPCHSARTAGCSHQGVMTAPSKFGIWRRDESCAQSKATADRSAHST